MIASLGMYDRPETAAANDRLWAGIRDGLRAEGIDAPDALTRGAHAYWDAWQSPGLVFSQTCGFPFRAKLHDQVTLIGTPDYALPGCPPGHYNSVFVARKDDPRASLAEFSGAAFAFNEDLSQSGWAAHRRYRRADMGTFGPIRAFRGGLARNRPHRTANSGAALYHCQGGRSGAVLPRHRCGDCRP